MVCRLLWYSAGMEGRNVHRFIGNWSPFTTDWWLCNSLHRCVAVVALSCAYATMPSHGKCCRHASFCFGYSGRQEWTFFRPARASSFESTDARQYTLLIAWLLVDVACQLLCQRIQQLAALAFVVKWWMMRPELKWANQARHLHGVSTWRDVNTWEANDNADIINNYIC